METFMRLASDNLNLRYRCAKCAADLNLKNPRGFGKKYLIFETVDEAKILDNPIIRLRNLCGAFGSQMRLTCAECNTKLGYTIKKKYKIHLESLNMVSESNTEVETEKPELEQQGLLTKSNAQMNTVELPDSEREAELNSQPEMNLASESVKEFEAGQPKPEKESHEAAKKEEGEGSKKKEPEKMAGTETEEIKEEEGEASGQLPPVMSHQTDYETLKSKIAMLSEENDQLKTRIELLYEREKERVKEEKKIEEQMLKGGVRVVSMVRKIEHLYREVEKIKNMKKESEHALKTEKERNGCLVLELEKMKVELEAIKAKEEPVHVELNSDSVQFPEPEQDAELNSEPVKEAETGQVAEIELQPKPEIEEGVGFTGLAKPVHVEQPGLKPASSDKKDEPEGSGKNKKKRRNKNKKKKKKKTKHSQEEADQLVTSCPEIK